MDRTSTPAGSVADVRKNYSFHPQTGEGAHTLVVRTFQGLRAPLVPFLLHDSLNTILVAPAYAGPYKKDCVDDHGERGIGSESGNRFWWYHLSWLEMRLTQ